MSDKVNAGPASATLALRNKQAPRIITHDRSFSISAQVQHQLPQRAVVQNIVADDAVLQPLVHDAVGGAPLAGVPVVAARLNAVAHARNALGTFQQDLAGVVAFRVRELAAALDEVAGDGDLHARPGTLSQRDTAGSST